MEQELIELFKNVSVVDAVRTIMEVGILGTGIALGVKKCYRALPKIQKRININATQNQRLDQHDNDICNFSTKLDKITDTLDTNKEVTKIMIRFDIVNACMKAIERGKIYRNELQSISDLYEVYSGVLKGNSYVSTLYEKVCNLPIIE